LRPLLLALVAATMTLAACGGDDSAKTTPTPAASTDLSAIKTYLLDHTQRLSRDVATMKDGAQQYHDLAEQSSFDTRKLLADHRPEVARLLRTSYRSLKAGLETSDLPDPAWRTSSAARPSA